MSATIIPAVITPAKRARTQSDRKRSYALWGSYAALAVFVIFFLTPPFYMLVTSLKTASEISAEHGNPGS